MKGSLEWITEHSVIQFLKELTEQGQKNLIIE
jgi:hypothetical protein